MSSLCWAGSMLAVCDLSSRYALQNWARWMSSRALDLQWATARRQLNPVATLQDFCSLLIYMLPLTNMCVSQDHDLPEVHRELMRLLRDVRLRPRLQLRLRHRRRQGGRLRGVLADVQLRGGLQLRRRLQVRREKIAC